MLKDFGSMRAPRRRVAVSSDKRTQVQIEHELGLEQKRAEAGRALLDHGAMAGLTDEEDHPYALLVNGGRQLSDDWDAGSHTIRAQGLGVRNAAGALRYRWVYNEALDTMDLEYVP